MFATIRFIALSLPCGEIYVNSIALFDSKCTVNNCYYYLFEMVMYLLWYLADTQHSKKIISFAIVNMLQIVTNGFTESTVKNGVDNVETTRLVSSQLESVPRDARHGMLLACAKRI